MIRFVLCIACTILLFAAFSVAEETGGKSVYQEACATCHDSGLAGAPEYGDEKAWQKRLEKGMATLVKHAIEGYKGMPAKGGNPSLSDAEVEAAVRYMAGEGR